MGKSAAIAARLRRALPYGDECPIEGCSWDVIASEWGRRFEGAENSGATRRLASLGEMQAALLVITEALSRLGCPRSFIEMAEGAGGENRFLYLSPEKREALRRHQVAEFGPVVGELVFELRDEASEEYDADAGPAELARAINDKKRVGQLVGICLPRIREHLAARSSRTPARLGTELAALLVGVCEFLKDCRGFLES